MKWIKLFEGFTDDQINNLVKQDKTYVFKNIRSFNNKELKYSKDIINYDISNFIVEFEYNYYKIYPDDNFKILYKKYCIENNFSPKELVFGLSILPEPLIKGYIYNKIDSEYFLPDNNLKGLSLGYKLYKFILNKVGFIMSDYSSSPDAKNLWFNLLKDSDVYSGTNKYYSIIIKKNIDNSDLKSLMDKIHKFNLIYENDLKIKIKEIYE
jgi:hypothetical protein